jgi:hypothetical protein
MREDVVNFRIEMHCGHATPFGETDDCTLPLFLDALDVTRRRTARCTCRHRRRTSRL